MNRERERARFSIGAMTGIGLSVIVLASVAAAEKRDPPARLAYVSVQRVAGQSAAAVAASKSIQQFREERTREITEKRRAVEAVRLRIAQLGGVFQASKRAEARQEEARALADLQRLETDAQTRLQTMQRDATAEFQRDLMAVIGDLARQRGTDVVLNQDTAVIWAHSGMDWTDDVGRAVNARHQQ